MAETITIEGTVYDADELSEIIGISIDPPLNDDDIARIDELIDRATSSRGAASRLLSATVVASVAVVMASRSPGIRYAADINQYFNGRTPISEDEIQRLVDSEKSSISRQSYRLAQRLVRGQISLAEYQEQVADIVTIGYLRMAAIGNGGQFSDSDYRGIQQLLWGTGPGRGVLRRILGTAAALAAGTITAAVFLDRSRRYGNNTAVGFNLSQHNARRQLWEGRRFLDPLALHCPQCPDHERLDWVDLSDIVPIGFDCSCHGNCRCRIEYRRKPR